MCRDNHYKKDVIVFFSDAVVDPSAVVVEPIDTPITYFAVSGGVLDVTVTGVAVEAGIQIFYDLLPIPVAVDEQIGIYRVYFRSQKAGDHQHAEISDEENDHDDSVGLILEVVLDGRKENHEDSNHDNVADYLVEPHSSGEGVDGLVFVLGYVHYYKLYHYH